MPHAEEVWLPGLQERGPEHGSRRKACHCRAARGRPVRGGRAKSYRAGGDTGLAAARGGHPVSFTPRGAGTPLGTWTLEFQYSRRVRPWWIGESSSPEKPLGLAGGPCGALAGREGHPALDHGPRHPCLREGGTRRPGQHGAGTAAGWPYSSSWMHRTHHHPAHSRWPVFCSSRAPQPTAFLIQGAHDPGPQPSPPAASPACHAPRGRSDLATLSLGLTGTEAGL